MGYTDWKLGHDVRVKVMVEKLKDLMKKKKRVNNRKQQKQHPSKQFIHALLNCETNCAVCNFLINQLKQHLPTHGTDHKEGIEGNDAGVSKFNEWADSFKKKNSGLPLPASSSAPSGKLSQQNKSNTYSQENGTLVSKVYPTPLTKTTTNQKSQNKPKKSRAVVRKLDPAPKLSLLDTSLDLSKCSSEQKSTFTFGNPIPPQAIKTIRNPNSQKNPKIVQIPKLAKSNLIPQTPRKTQFLKTLNLRQKIFKAKNYMNIQKQFNCEFCDRTYKSSSELIHHNGKPHRYQCQVCPKRFTRTEYMDLHMKNHENDDPSTSTPDPPVQSSIINMNQRIGPEYQQPEPEYLQCSVDPNFFRHFLDISMIENPSTDHKPEDNFTTEMNAYDYTAYGKSMKSAQSLSTHMTSHPVERSFKCEECHKTFKTRANLTSHQRVHTGEKLFNCELCGKEYNSPSGLKYHMATHQGKSYHCEVCEKSFYNKYRLIEHTRVHTGEKPFNCEICGRSYHTQSNLNVHIKTHHGKEDLSVGPINDISCD